LGSGFRNAGFRIGLAVEMDRDAAQSYRLNNPGVHVMEADVGTISSRDVLSLVGSRPAVICAGPPCQSYSAAGSRATRDPRHHLFRHILSLARDLKPKAVLIENVPGIRRKIGCKSYKDVIERELGKQFSVEVHLLRALDYGVPQLRRRYFFFGRRKRLAPFGVPSKTHKEKGHSGRLPQAPTVMDVLKELPRRQQGQSKDWARMSDGTLLWNVGTMKHAPRVIKKISEIRGTEGPLSYRRVSREYANTIVAGHRALPVHPTLHRTLSVREAACVQGFDKEYVFLGARANQPLQVANAVPPPLARAIARHLRRKVARSRKTRKSVRA
jgi:DNA (cytosine-5)-methyltransferase 1